MNIKKAKKQLGLMLGVNTVMQHASANGLHTRDTIRVELLPAFKFTGKLVKIKEFTSKW